jgi:hypothetical protein
MRKSKKSCGIKSLHSSSPSPSLSLSFHLHVIAKRANNKKGGGKKRKNLTKITS